MHQILVCAVILNTYVDDCQPKRNIDEVIKSEKNEGTLKPNRCGFYVVVKAYYEEKEDVRGCFAIRNRALLI